MTKGPSLVAIAVPSQLPVSNGQALPVDAVLEEFVIEKVLGSGGFGITYLAWDSTLGRRVLIKENLRAEFCWRETAFPTVKPLDEGGWGCGKLSVFAGEF